MSPAESADQCVWIVPGDQRRHTLINVPRSILLDKRVVMDQCGCCGEMVECDDPHLCTDCCQGRT